MKENRKGRGVALRESQDLIKKGFLKIRNFLKNRFNLSSVFPGGVSYRQSLGGFLHGSVL